MQNGGMSKMQNTIRARHNNALGFVLCYGSGDDLPVSDVGRSGEQWLTKRHLPGIYGRQALPCLQSARNNCSAPLSPSGNALTSSRLSTCNSQLIDFDQNIEVNLALHPK
jgi:hypothetical protein